MINDDFNPFSDEIKDQKGNIVCKKGQTLTIDEIESMDYLVDGVIGSTNKEIIQIGELLLITMWEAAFPVNGEER